MKYYSPKGAAAPIGKLRRDESSHWYVIPDEKVEAFDKDSEKLAETLVMSDKYDDLCANFSDLYRQYMTGGGISHLDVIIPE